MHIFVNTWLFHTSKYSLPDCNIDFYITKFKDLQKLFPSSLKLPCSLPSKLSPKCMSNSKEYGGGGN